MKGSLRRLWFRLRINYKVRTMKPIYIVDVLMYIKYVNRYYNCGICCAFYEACRSLVGKPHNPHDLMNKYKSRTAVVCFGAERNGGYWWHPSDWQGGRMDFLNWLIEEYKDDKTDLRTLKL